MNSLRVSLVSTVACGLWFSAAATASAGPKDYQFTGPITSMTDTMFVVQRGKENWEFAKNADTKTPADLKVGDRVTVHYVMNAVSIEPNSGGAKGASKDKPAAGKPEAAASPKP